MSVKFPGNGRKLFVVKYWWREDESIRRGRTVCEGRHREDALCRFKRLNPHVTAFIKKELRA